MGGRGGGAGGAAGGGGAAGMAGRGGASGAPYSCPLGGVLDCSPASALDLTPGGELVSFSAQEWSSTAPTDWCDVNGLDGGIFMYAGGPAPTDGMPASSSVVTVDATARNLRLALTVAPMGYAGGGVSFDSCVDASAFDAIAFSASVTAGNLTNCVWQVQLQTQDQRPTTATDPTGGTCATNCYRYPAATLATPVTATYTIPFTAFNNPASSTIATATQVVGVQWQVNSGASGTGRCMVELRIDDVRFVMQ
jgi:hypothetical protein